LYEKQYLLLLQQHRTYFNPQARWTAIGLSASEQLSDLRCLLDVQVGIMVRNDLK